MGLRPRVAPAAAVGPHRAGLPHARPPHAGLPRAATQASARTGVQAPARTGARARPRVAAPALPRTVARALRVTGALRTARTGVRVLPRTAGPRIAAPAVQARVRPSTAGQTDPPAAPTRAVSRAGRPGPRRATGRDDPQQRDGLQQAAIRIAAPARGPVRAGLRTMRAHAAGVQPVPVTADPRRAAEPVVPVGLVRRVPPAAATGARVLRGRVLTARAGTIATGALPGRVVSDPVLMARRIGRFAMTATPPGGRHVTGQQDPLATPAATGPRGRPAPGTVTAPGPASITGAAAGSAQVAAVPGAATIPGAAIVPGAAAVPGAAIVPGALSVPGPSGTRRRLGRARPGRSSRTRSLPSSSIPRRGHS